MPAARAGFVQTMALISLAALLGAGPASAQLSLRTKATSAQEIVVSANPLAAEAGALVLRDGGNAIDAAIAVQAVLGLTEPQSTGIGGGGFLLHFEAATRAVTSFDARETAPAAATPFYFYNASSQPLALPAAVLSGRSVGVPGIVKLWEAMSRRHGSQPLARVLQPAIELATTGFSISPRLAAAIEGSKANLAQDPGAAAYFLNADGTGKAAGTILQNPAYAQTLGRIAFAGARAFYQGPVAQDIVTTVTSDPRPGGPGAMTLADLANYQVIERTPVCGNYRVYVVCGMGPPSSGGIATLQMLGILDRVDLAALGPDTAQTVHAILQANRLAFADR
ncbi:MAG: gamma-glutamyltransferase, partial [Gemmatimonadaceae bacterium]|nr:gamma-glutamyltransferase [Acetobacteraceae bacterium]